MYQSEQINELAAALSKAQSEIKPAIKDSSNPFFKSKYADLSNVWSACQEPLTKNGLSVLQTLDYKDGQTFLITILAHSSGQWVKSCIPIICAKQDAQSMGSAITYMRRYSLAAMVGVTTEDDDGNAATKSTVSKSQASELESILDKCPASYRKQTMDYLARTANVTSLEDLPTELYAKVKNAALLKREEAEKSQMASV